MTVPGVRARVFRSELSLEGRHAVYSTAAPLTDGDSAEIRFYNDSRETDTVKVTLPAFATEAALIELDGRLISDLPIENGAVSVTLPPFRIATVRFA